MTAATSDLPKLKPIQCRIADGIVDTYFRGIETHLLMFWTTNNPQENSRRLTRKGFPKVLINAVNEQQQQMLDKAADKRTASVKTVVFDLGLPDKVGILSYCDTDVLPGIFSLIGDADIVSSSGITSSLANTRKKSAMVFVSNPLFPFGTNDDYWKNTLAIACRSASTNWNPNLNPNDYLNGLDTAE